MSKKAKPTSTDAGTNALAQLVTLVETVTALVGNPPALTATDIKRSTKLRKGGETVIPTVAALANQFGLTSKAHPTDAMVEKAKLAQSLIPLHKQLVATTKQVGDAMFLANSESWASAAVHYATLRKMATTDGSVAKTLLPVTQFFAHRAPAVVTAADAKRGGKKGSKAAQAAKAAEVAQAQVAAAEAHAHVSPAAPVTDAPVNNESPAPTTAPATPPTAAPSPAPINAAHS